MNRQLGDYYNHIKDLVSYFSRVEHPKNYGRQAIKEHNKQDLLKALLEIHSPRYWQEYKRNYQQSTYQPTEYEIESLEEHYNKIMYLKEKNDKNVYSEIRNEVVAILIKLYGDAKPLD